MRKKLVESSVGVRTTEETARHIDELLKALPKGKQYEYRRKGTPGTDTTVQAVERTDVSRVTTRAMDRDNEIVLPEGIELDQYRVNPVVLWGHDQDRPVGKALWVKPDAEGLLAKSQYISRPARYVGEWLPDFVFSMIQADVLRGKSIGFLPLEIRDPSPEELAVNPQLQLVISRSLLLEYSVVSVPSNPLALVEIVSKGQHLDHWQFKNIGPVKQKAKARAKPRVYHPITEALNELTLDPTKIADLAIKQLAEKWGV
jgi:phage head maturation protease